MWADELSFYDKDALLYRLHEGLLKSGKKVIFVVGSPLTAPYHGEPGVGDVNAIVSLVRTEFADKAAQIERLDTALSNSANPYQTAFDFLSGRAGQDAANRIIKRAVAQALLPTGDGQWADSIVKLTDDQLRDLDDDPSAWHLNRAVDSLGSLIAQHTDHFGRLILTSNFDPLIEVAIKRAGGTAWRTSLSVDGSITQSTAPGCQVVHIHGYWYGADTLHTSRQLIKSRPTLKNDLLTMLQNKIVVVVAYGGWPDIFTGALSGVVSNDNLFPEILWTAYGDNPALSEHVYTTLRPGIDRNRVTFYKGIDCHELFPELFHLWSGHEGEECAKAVRQRSFSITTHTNRQRPFRLPALECDRPPNIDVWVGRENELRALETSNARIVIVCGMGGEGKSVLASHYIQTLGEREDRYRLWDWRDCREQGDRIRTQIIEIIVRFSKGEISADQLSEAEDTDLIDILTNQIRDANAILVFDNVDSYVDLENRTFIGALDLLVQRLSEVQSTSRIVLTCRPDVQYAAASVITIPVKGISENEAIELFSKRALGQAVPEQDIYEAHALTKGHAFWLDLLAVQVMKVPGTTLRRLLDDMRRGREGVPDVLSSIWDKLSQREQTLLRFMAETVRPETEKIIERFVASQLNYQKFSRALRALISLNLIVVKPEIDAPDLYDLHPLVRQFVRNKFARAERSEFIRVVINQYEEIIGAIGSLLGVNLPFAMLERWSQKAELQVSAALYNEAFETLVKIEDAFMGGGHVQEFVRVGRLLFEAIDWETAAGRYRHFDDIVGVMVAAYNQLDDIASANNLLARYEATIPQKTARYIKFCDIRAYSHWVRGEFSLAIDWATKGVALKNETNVDTAFDCEHTLALAQRDSGQPELALEYFRSGLEITEIISGSENVPDNGAIYGNVGRCLQFTGRMNDALSCYRKSMKILEQDTSSHSKSNRAYARRWVGEVFAQLNDLTKSEAFLMDAIRILGTSAPARVREIHDYLEQVRRTGSRVNTDAEAARIVESWMRG